MPTAVLDLDLKNLPSQITGLDAYSKALVLIRYNRQPLGKITLPVTNGRLDIEIYKPDLIYIAEPQLTTTWLHDYLDYTETDVLNFVPPKATIAICTRNRTEDLRRCLDALMKLPDDGQEILVVDNCPSTDETQKLVESYSSVRYVRENNKGLDFARNRALKEARHEIVAFTDDDATPDPLWLRALVRNFNSPLVMCVTGMTMPLELETEAQEVFETFSPFGKGFKRIVHTNTSGDPLSTGQVGAGANMAVRKDVQQAVGLFDEALDAGTPTQSGGDHEFFSRILLAGYHIVYEPQALSWHRHRRTMQETIAAIKGYGTGVYAYWTKLLVTERELGVLKLPYGWFIHVQLPHIIRSLLGTPNSLPLRLLFAELEGCILGPWKYFSSRRQVTKKRKDV